MVIKKLIAIISVFALAISLSTAVLAQEVSEMPDIREEIDSRKKLDLPQAANDSDVVSLGSVKGDDGRMIEGFAIIHRKESARSFGNNRAPKTSCYGYLAKGAKWKTNEVWVVNGQNSRGLGTNFVASTLSFGISKWEDATDGNVTNGSGANVLGDGSITSDVLVADQTAPDNKNEVYFADVSSAGAIAVTIVWGIFGGPTFSRELIEWDMIFDDVDFDWSSSGEVAKMDFENIATHELGHAVGMADLYNNCLDETMYGFAANGETKKRDLNSGDILGVNLLY